MLIKALPIAMMALSIGASAVYFYHGDIRQGIYWAAATVLNAAVTF